MEKFFTLLTFFSFIFNVSFSQAPTGFQGTAYNTSAHLQWDHYTVFEPIGYNIYRSTQSGDYGPPSRRIGAYDDYTDYNLLANATYFYKITAFDKNGIESPLSDEIMIATNNSSYLKIANLDLLIPIYTGGMSATAPEEIMQGLEFSREIFYRNTFGQLNLKFHYMVIEGYPPVREDGMADFNTIGADLKARGILDNQYDAIHICALKLYGWRGGALWLGQTAGSMAYNWTGFDAENHYTRGDAWVFTHEFGHSLDLIIAKKSGFPEMVFNHFAHAHPMIPEIGVFDSGENFDGMALVLRLFEHHLEYKAPWDAYLEVIDNDNDGLADNDARLLSDEVRFGSNPNSSDTDGDGLDDLEEFTADIYKGSNPNNPDTDGDGEEDGTDNYPASNFQLQNEKATQPVNIDGVLSNNEDWQPMGSNPFYSKIPSAKLDAFTTWDDDYLYFAFQSNEHLKYFLMIDGNGEDGIFTSKYRWEDGDYTSFDANSLGCSYFDQASLIIRANDSEVYKNEMPLPGSQISTFWANDVYTTEVKLPHNLGPGFGFNYTSSDAPVITELSFEENDILGIQLIATPLAGSNAHQWNDWKTKDWLILNQPFHYYDMTLTDSGTSNEYCASISDFPWHEWISAVSIGSIEKESAKSSYSDFTHVSTDIVAGNTTGISLTTAYSYFTFDEYWRVWIDFNQDGDFFDAHEQVFSGIQIRPPDGTASATLNGNMSIPTDAISGETRMRISMKRGAYADPCETLPFGEVEDYTVNIINTPTLPELSIPSIEIIPGGNFLCYTAPGESFQYFGGVILNSGFGAAGSFNLKALLSKDNQVSTDDVLWKEFQYTGINPNSVVGFSINDPVPELLAPGKHYAILLIDSQNQVPETNEANNLLEFPIQIGAPDFIVSTINDLSESASAGSTLNFSAELTNLASFPLIELSGTLPISVYLSEDATFDYNGDLQIGTAEIAYNSFSNPPLYNNGTATVNVTALIPDDMLDGDYFIFVRINNNCETTVTNNFSDALPIRVEAGTSTSYCTSSSNFPWHEWIAGVELANMSNPSEKSQYSDFTSMVADVLPGQTYPVNLTTAFSYFTADEYWRIWIDFNRDNDFTDPGEMIFSEVLTAPLDGTTAAVLNGNVTFPSNVSSGTTRMRVSMKRGDFASPCESLSFGEVEDYSIHIGEGVGCSIVYTINNVQCQDNGSPENPDDDTFTFEVLVTGTGVSQSWQMTYIGGSVSGSYSEGKVVGSLPISIFSNGFDFTISDNVNGSCSTSGSFSPPSSCSIPPADYCESYSDFPWEDWIAGVQLNTVDKNSGKSTYSDFTNLSTTLQTGESYDINLTTGFSYFTWDEHWSVWIDLNHDNVFHETNELVFSTIATAPADGTDTYGTTGNFVLPQSAMSGPTRMRISMKREAFANSCETLLFGEVEDYTVNIINTTAKRIPASILEGLSTANDFTLFPNPAHSEIYISMQKASETAIQWNIMDTYGRILWSKEISDDVSSPYRIDIGHLEAGMYMLQSMAPGRKVESKRFVVVK